MRLICLFATLVFAGTVWGQNTSKLQDIPLKDINGKETSLKEYAGKVLLIVNVASIAATRAIAGAAVYSATKAAIRRLVRSWTLELKDRHIRSNVLSPGPIATPLAAAAPPDDIAGIVSTVPMGRMGEPEEVARAALFLASDESSYVTGIELFVDGGRAQV